MARKRGRHKAVAARLPSEARTAHIQGINECRVDCSTFTIFLSGEDMDTEKSVDYGEPGVEYKMADRFERNLSILSGIDSERPVLVKQASEGGHWEPGMQMFSAILLCPNPVTVLATRWARSMTSIIPLAADKFVLTPPAQYMYHRGSDGFDGLDQEVDTYDVERRKARELMMRLYVARLKEQGKFSGWPEFEIRKMLEQGIKDKIDVWLSADEAREYGFIDDVFDGSWNTLRAKKKNLFRRKQMLAVLRKPITVEVIVK